MSGQRSARRHSIRVGAGSHGRFALLLAATAILLPGLSGSGPADAAYPGANGKIVWVGSDAGSDYGIWLMNADGSGKTRLLLGQGDEADPVWSPDGRKVAFSRSGFFPSGCTYGEIYVMNADGSGLTGITGGSSATESDPTWSPDGERIAYHRLTRDEQCQIADNGIWVMNADGSGQTGLTSGGSTILDAQPAWSPDGQKIAFRSDREIYTSSYRDEIYTMNPDGSQVTRLTNTESPNNGAIFSSSPAWSPDGQQVAYVRIDFFSTYSEIWVMNADGSQETAVTQNGFVDNRDPAWSPDGQKILFAGMNTFCDACNSEIYSINVDGSGQTQLTDNTTIDWMPDWQPLPASGDVVVTDCADPELAGLTVVAGDLIIQNLDDCGEISLAHLTQVSGDLVINDTSATAINLAALVSTSGSLTITDNPSAGNLDLGSLANVAGDLVISGNDAATAINLAALVSTSGSLTITDNPSAGNLDLGSLANVAGDLVISGNDTVTAINLAALVSTSGSLTIADNPSAGNLDLGSLAEVGGDLDLESVGTTVNVGGVTVSGDLTLTGIGSDSVSATTGGGTTQVTVLGGTAAMRVFLPAGTFDQPVPFTIERQGDAPPVAGAGADGAAVTIDPLAAYRFTFAIPTLNQQAQLAFAIDLAQLDGDTRAALLAGVADGSATLAVKGDGAGDIYQAFARCAEGQTPATDGCVTVTPLDLAGGTPAPGAEPALVRFDGVAGGFSTYAAALVLPLDATPPAIVPTVGGTLGGAGFYTSDVSISWSVEDPESAITEQTGCASQTVTADTAGVTITCEATSAGGTASESVTIRRDATPPVITGSRAPGPNAHGWNNTDVTVQFSCADNLSGLESCGPTQVVSEEGRLQARTGAAVDLAGNRAESTVGFISIDETAPTIVARVLAPANVRGWHQPPVTVEFHCADALSGIAFCPPALTLTEPGLHAVGGHAIDLAGNAASISLDVPVARIVTIDIKPDGDPNAHGCAATKSQIAVAILSTAAFDAGTVDAGSVRFGKTGGEAAEAHRDRAGNAIRHVKDVNGDGRLDIVLHFRLGDTGFGCADIPAGASDVTLPGRLTGLAGGISLDGVDAIRLVGASSSKRRPSDIGSGRRHAENAFSRSIGEG